MKARFNSDVRDLSHLPEAVWKRTGALNTWGTNAIEGNTLTLDEVEKLLIEQVSVPGRPVPDVLETVQHEAAFRGLLARVGSPITLISVQELHDEVFRGIPRYRPGQWRLSNVIIAGAAHRPPRREKVVPRMNEWEWSYETRFKTRENVFSLGAWMHHEFESVHPFEDGNGRTGRLLLNLHFLKAGWPPLHILPDDRDEYLRALTAGHEGDYASLAGFLEMRMARSLLDLLDQVSGPEDELRELKTFSNERWNPYGAHYLSLRARQGSLVAVRVTNRIGPEGKRKMRGRPAWLTSERALRYYVKHVGRRAS